jgi:hypothetical protein
MNLLSFYGSEAGTPLTSEMLCMRLAENIGMRPNNSFKPKPLRGSA